MERLACILNAETIKNPFNNERKQLLKGYMENPHAAIVQKINSKYWKRLFTLNDISRLMPSDIHNQYFCKINEMADFDFNERNILQLKKDLARSFVVNIDKAIMAIFDKFTHKYSYEENSPNIHYYNGWKTNKAFYCNKKVIIPLRMFNYHSAFISPFNGKNIGHLRSLMK